MWRPAPVRCPTSERTRAPGSSGPFVGGPEGIQVIREFDPQTAGWQFLATSGCNPANHALP